jgi:hypothetical protein
MAQAVSRRPLAGPSRFRAQVNPRGICGGQSGTETAFLRVLQFPMSISYYPSVVHVTWGGG